MATNSPTKKPLTYALSYGFLGGPLQARKFKSLMNQAGYEHSEQLQKADIIIAHSAGTWLIPKDCNPKLVMYVGMPLAQASPNRTRLLARKGYKMYPDLLLTIKSRYYLFAKLRHNITIYRMAKTASAVTFNKVPAVFIANRHDPWPDDPRLEPIVESKPWAFIGLPGSHNDIWQNSDRYVEIIERYAGLLA